MKQHKKNILVTGGAGFIGCNFVRHVLKNDPHARIINLDALTYAGSLDNLKDLPDPSRHFFARGSICDRTLVDQLLRQHEIDAVVHFAAESHVDRSIAEPGAFVQTNVVGSFTLLEACRQYWQQEMQWSSQQCRFHHVSTDEVYGALSATDPPSTESTPYAPNSPYAASKAASDHLARAYFRTYQLPVVTTNCSNNFGPYQHQEKFIPAVIRACMDQTPIPVYGDGSNIRDWLYVDDHCAGILTVLNEGRLGETYNIGGGNELSNIDVVKLICRLMDQIKPAGAPHEKLISFVADRPGHDWRYAIDASKLTRELGWKRTERFDEEMRETIIWQLAR